MTHCPKCRQLISGEDVAECGDIVWGRCAHCNILFRVVPEALKHRPPEARFRLWNDRGRLCVQGKRRGIFATEHRLSFGRDDFHYRWNRFFFGGKTTVPRGRLQSVEPMVREGTGKRPFRTGCGILITYWCLGSRDKRRPRLKAIRIPVNTISEQDWLLNEICGFLDRTTRYPSMFLKYRAKEHFGNDALEMFYENRTVCLRIHCPRCGSGIPGGKIDIRAGRAYCVQKYCRHVFSWRDLFEAPLTEEEPPTRSISSRVAGYGDLNDVRAVHFAVNANPLASIPFGADPPSTAPLPRLFFERPRIVRKHGTLAVGIEAAGKYRKETGFAFFHFLLVCFLVLFLPACLVDDVLETGHTGDAFARVLVFPVLFLPLLAFLHYSFRYLLACLYRTWGRWDIVFKAGTITYCRSCGRLRSRVSFPFSEITEVGANTVSQGRFDHVEAFTPHQVRIDYGVKKKTLVIPCNNTDEQLWILGELYESLRR
ncbi:MAG TPA: hypothetical protein DEB39_10900 [Planctomycetaceae bacterium]|nr:hypothetical protein [Planctomycetaceae bacterium]